ncbi:MAG: hypothetical protein HYU64_00440 [Armatimonadetes bacterium]|nr:hypothetical protein [Armatimonadota bacterium]
MNQYTVHSGLMFGDRWCDYLRLDRGQIEVLDDAMAEILRAKTPAERIRIGCEIWISTHKMLTAHLKTTHPDWVLEKVNREVVRRMSHGTV